MRPPTAEEIDRAREAIARHGPQAPATVTLAMLVVKNPVLRAFVERIATGILSELLYRRYAVLGLHAVGTVSAKALMEGAVSGGMVCGLNIGLRIAEERERLALEKKNTPET